MPLPGRPALPSLARRRALPLVRALARVLGALLVALLAPGLARTAAAQTPVDTTAARETSADSLLAALLAAPVEADAALTLDSLDMSAWERIWWGRRGAMRLTGLFPTHPDRPGADVRQVARVRRKMLFVHQVVGLASVASMAATVVTGQRALEGGDPHVHHGTLPVTIGLYSAGAALAFLSPPALPTARPRRLDSITLHRYLAIGHMAGMIATPLLAPSNGRWSRRHVHQALGYATLATYSAATLVVTFRR